MAHSRRSNPPAQSGRSAELEVLIKEIDRDNDELRRIGENHEKFLHPALKYANDALSQFSFLANRQEGGATYNGKLPTVDEVLSLYLSLGKLLSGPVAKEVRHPQKLEELLDSEDNFLAVTARLLVLATEGNQDALRVHLDEIYAHFAGKVIAGKLRTILDQLFNTNVEPEVDAQPQQRDFARDKGVSKASASILKVLHTHPTLLTIEEICGYLKDTLADRTIGPELKRLIDAGLAARPQGKRKGATLTPAGKALAEKLPAQK